MLDLGSFLFLDTKPNPIQIHKPSQMVYIFSALHEWLDLDQIFGSQLQWNWLRDKKPADATVISDAEF